MSINSINPNDPIYKASASGTSAQNSAADSIAQTSALTSENSLQSAQLSDDGSFDLNSMENMNAMEQHRQIMKQLQEELNFIRQQKQSLISQMAFVEDADERQSISSELKDLNKQADSVYMDIVKELQNYNNTLTELISGTVKQKVEESSVIQGIQSSSISPSALQTTLDGYNAQAGQKIAQSAHTVDGTTGWCLKGVNDSLQRIYGKRLSYNSAYQAIPELQSGQGMGEHFREVSVSRDELSSLPAGAIVVWEASPGHEHGHISIALGDGRESSDHITSQMTSRDANFHVFIPVS